MDKITLFKERKSGCEGLCMKLTDSPSAGQGVAEIAGAVMVSRKWYVFRE